MKPSKVTSATRTASIVLAIFLTIVNAHGRTVNAQSGCDQGPSNPKTSDSHDLDNSADNDNVAEDWGVFCEGSTNPPGGLPTRDLGIVSTPSSDGQSLKCSITGSNPPNHGYANVHCYRNLQSEPNATKFILTFSFQLNAATTNTVQALEFTVNKWFGCRRYELALQWRNIGPDAQHWHYWDPSQSGDRWVSLPVTDTLQSGKWYSLELEGEIVNNNDVLYKRFKVIDDQLVGQDRILNITVPSAYVPAESDRLAVGIQLDGNSTEDPYDVYVDKVEFLRTSNAQAIAFPAPSCLRGPDNLNPPRTTRPLFDWNNVDGALSYNIQVATDQNFTRLVLNLNVTPSAYVPTGDLPKGTLLFWRVRANGTNGPSAWSRVRHFDSPNPPSVPILLLPANNATVANGLPALDWSDSSPGVDHYEVQISTSETFATSLGRGQGGRTPVSQYTPEVALSTGMYHWRVRAVNAQGQFSQWSAPRRFSVP